MVLSYRRQRRKIYFEILEKPMGKQRPRYSSYSRTMYTPNETKKYEELIREYFYSSVTKKNKLSEKAFRVNIIAIYEPIKSMSKKQKENLIRNQSYYTKKSDVDNIAKIVMDALNGIVYKDDAQICELFVQKKYGEKNKIVVEMEELKE